MIKVRIKKIGALFLTFFGGFCCLSMTWSHYNLLSQEDRDLENLDRQEQPVLSSALDSDFYWESFNEWQCFSTENIQFECTELDHGVQYVPTMRISRNEELFDFSLDPEHELDCKGILNEWSALLEHEGSFCTYAAYLQDLPNDSFEAEGINFWGLWIVSQVKSRKGYWKKWGSIIKDKP